MTLTLRKGKQHQLLSRMLLVWLLIAALRLAVCSTESAASASLSARSAVLIQPSTAIIRQFALLSSSQLPSSVDACSELWAEESASNSDAAS